MRDFSVHEIINIMQQKKYKIYDRDDLDYNINLVGIRSATLVPNYFDDWFYVFWKYHNQWNKKRYSITTDPGLYWLENPINVNGTAILKEGQYLGLWKIGKHKGKYLALVQANPCTVIRDANRNNQLNYNSGYEETGFFGINCHRATSNGRSQIVEKWSAGCQVFADSKEFDEFMNICQLAAQNWGNSFSYTLLNERDFEGVV